MNSINTFLDSVLTLNFAQLGIFALLTICIVIILIKFKIYLSVIREYKEGQKKPYKYTIGLTITRQTKPSWRNVVAIAAVISTFILTLFYSLVY